MASDSGSRLSDVSLRIHLLGSLATPTIPELTGCAFNQTLLKYSSALHHLGHRVILYGTEEYGRELSEICSEFVPICSLKTFEPLLSETACIEKFNAIPIPEEAKTSNWATGFDMLKRWFSRLMWHPRWNELSAPEKHQHLLIAFSYGPYLSNCFETAGSDSQMVGWVAKVIHNEVRAGMNAILSRIQPRDLIVFFWDTTNLPLFRQCEKRGGIVIEGLVQYGTIESAPSFNRTIFSSADQRKLRYERGKDMGAHHYVIPPFFDPNDFIFNPNPRDPKGPFLYLGRIQEWKGVLIILHLAKAYPDLTFWIAGSGKFSNGILSVHLNQGNFQEWDLTKFPNVKFWGFADKALRASLLSEATAIIQPSNYREPFGWNIVEAHFSGTPAIAPFWGAFPENINGFNGILYDPNLGTWDTTVKTLRPLLDRCCMFDPSSVRATAMAKYTEGEVMDKYVQTLIKIHSDPGGLLAGEIRAGSKPAIESGSSESKREHTEDVITDSKRGRYARRRVKRQTLIEV